MCHDDSYLRMPGIPVEFEVTVPNPEVVRVLSDVMSALTALTLLYLRRGIFPRLG